MDFSSLHLKIDKKKFFWIFLLFAGLDNKPVSVVTRNINISQNDTNEASIDYYSLYIGRVFQSILKMTNLIKKEVRW